MRPRLFDLLLAAGVAALAMAYEQRAVAAVAVAGVAAVLARRRWPVPTLAVVTAVTAVLLVIGPPPPTFVLLLAVLTYNVTLTTTHRRSWLLPVGASVVLLVAGLIADPAQWRNVSDVVSLFALICGSGAVGDAIRNRRALLAEMADRVRQAEQTREEEARRRVMDERLRIARELHDVVAHHIAVINVQAGAAGHVIEQHPDRAGPVLEVIRQASDNVLREIKSVIGVLRAPDDKSDAGPSPSLAGLGELVGGLSTAGFRVEVVVEGERRELPAIVDQAAYRIAQEALTNAHRHGTGAAKLLITYAPQEVTIEVANRVRPARPAGSGFGLLGMRERAAAVGGVVTAEPSGGGTFRVHATLPTASYALETAP